MNQNRRYFVAIAAVGAIVLSACGDGNAAPVLDPDQPTVSASPVTTVATDLTVDDTPVVTEPLASPVGTILADIPDEMREAVGPVDVVGDALPILETDVVSADPAVGKQAPTLLGLNFDGEPVRVDAAQDGATLVVFLAHWCPHCNAEVPVLLNINSQGLFPNDLKVVAVSTAANNTRPNFPPAQWLENFNWPFDVIADGVAVETDEDGNERPVLIAANAMGVSGFPFSVLISADGTVAARWSGEHSAEEILDLIKTNLN